MELSGDSIDKRIQELEKWRPVTDLRIKRLENEYVDTKTTRELFLKNVDTKFDGFENRIEKTLANKQIESKEYGNKRDLRMTDLEKDVLGIQKKVWFATGVIVAMQFLSPFILKFLKVI